jgi:uncharacterized damage-inducible protein DinB
MQYDRAFINPNEIPPGSNHFGHLVETYASETNKVADIWTRVPDEQLDYRIHPKSSSVRQILIHQILSERRFFAEFLGFNEPSVELLLPSGEAPRVRAYIDRFVDLARARLEPIAAADEHYWLSETPFFDVHRQRIWIFWRRLLHTAHHRTQVGMCLRQLEIDLPATYGPSADMRWTGADPTITLAAAKRGGTR